jgi:hypothetical protein
VLGRGLAFGVFPRGDPAEIARIALNGLDGRAVEILADEVRNADDVSKMVIVG